MIGILWDLDGTLLNTLSDLTAAVSRALTAFGYPPRTEEQVRRAVGDGAGMLLRRSLPEGTGEEVLAAVLAEFRKVYAENCMVKTRPYPGILPALKALGEYPMAVLSNKPDAQTKALCAAFFPGLPAFGERPGIPRKPAPEGVRLAMEALGVDKAVYIGDSQVDLATADNAGLPCLAVSWGFRTRQELEAAGAAAICDTPAAMRFAVKKRMEEWYGQ